MLCSSRDPQSSGGMPTGCRSRLPACAGALGACFVFVVCVAGSGGGGCSGSDRSVGEVTTYSGACLHLCRCAPTERPRPTVTRTTSALQRHLPPAGVRFEVVRSDGWSVGTAGTSVDGGDVLSRQSGHRVATRSWSSSVDPVRIRSTHSPRHPGHSCPHATASASMVRAQPGHRHVVGVTRVRPG